MQSSIRGALASLPEQGSPTTIRPGVIAVGQGQPVVLLHGSMSSKAQWNSLAQRLAPQYQAIAIDLHGYGDNSSSPRQAAFSVDDEVDFVLSRLDDFPGRRMPVHLVGHSYGGLVALRLAQRYPARAISLALYEPMVLSLLPRPHARMRWITADDPVAVPLHEVGLALTVLAGKRRNYEAAEACIDFWTGAGSFANLSLPAKARLAAGAAQTALNYQAEVSCPMRLDDVRSIRVPTLLLGGAHSPEVAQRIVRMLSMALPNSKLNWLKADHMAPISASDLVNPCVSAFIEAQAARTGDARVAPRTICADRAGRQ